MARKTLTQKLAGEKARSEQLQKEIDALRAHVANSLPPMTLVVSVCRVSGKTTISRAIDQGNPEPDVRLLLEIVREIEKNLGNELLRLTAERVRRETEKRMEKDGEAE